MSKKTPGCIRLRGVRQNNLKNIDLDVPLRQLVVIAGLSGSGKSSLAFETLFAEGQRRYIETFSPYARQFLDRMDKPQADSIEGIPPAIAIEQRNTVKSTRSTVGTMTEITDYTKAVLAATGATALPAVAASRCKRNRRKASGRPCARWRRTAEALVTFDLPLERKVFAGGIAGADRPAGLPAAACSMGRSSRLEEAAGAAAKLPAPPASDGGPGPGQVERGQTGRGLSRRASRPIILARANWRSAACSRSARGRLVPAAPVFQPAALRAGATWSTASRRRHCSASIIPSARARLAGVLAASSPLITTPPCPTVQNSGRRARSNRGKPRPTPSARKT